MGNRIALFNTISTVFLVMMILSLLIAVILFFVFDIRRIVGILSGRAARKGIQEMEQRTAKSGQLRTSSGERSQKLRKLEDVISYPTTGRMDKNSSASMAPAPSAPEVSPKPSQPDQSLGKFVLIKDEMLIHTKEII